MTARREPPAPLLAMRDRLRSSLEGRAHPVVVAGDLAAPGECLWTGALSWSRAFRSAGIVPGDRVIIAIEPSPAFLMVLTACLCDGIVACPIDPSAAREIETVLDRYDGKVIIGRAAGHWQPEGAGSPDRPVALRTARTEPTPSVAMLMRTSGSTHDARMIALSARNLLACIEAHEPCLSLSSLDVCLSVLPWHHAFGLIIDVLPAMLAGATIYREPSGGRDPTTIAAALRQLGVTHASFVPLQVARLLATSAGAAALRSLRGGVVGGAPVDADMALELSDTRLRAGYGLTEASPGVALGMPGEWTARLLGSPIGCEVRIDESGEVRVRGPNVCHGVWTRQGLITLDPERELATDDKAYEDDAGRLVFVGRCSDSFKLSNGRFVDAARIEHALRSRLDRGDVVVLPGKDASLRIVFVGSPPTESLTQLAHQELHKTVGPDCAVRVEWASELPRTPKGQIDRFSIAKTDIAAAVHASAIEGLAPCP